MFLFDFAYLDVILCYLFVPCSKGYVVEYKVSNGVIHLNMVKEMKCVIHALTLLFIYNPGYVQNNFVSSTVIYIALIWLWCQLHHGIGPGTPCIPHSERNHKTSGFDSRASCKEASCFKSPCNMVDCQVSSPGSWKKC
jgi:hypothetical protein